jgi:glycyl-tRNA synthetase alpha subunit
MSTENEKEVPYEEVTAQSEQNTPKEAANNKILFGSITYDNDEAYEQFISNMNVNQAVFVLVASANFSQAKGAFNLMESETLSAAIRAIRKSNQNLDETSK